MSRDRRGRRAEPPSSVKHEPLAPGPFEELFLKPSRPLDLDAAGAETRDVFPQQPAAGTTAAEGERESVIYSPFSPATESPPAFAQPMEPPTITMETGIFKPAPRSFERLVEELVPAPDEDESRPRARRRGIPLAAWVGGTVLLLAGGTAFLFRDRLAASVVTSPTAVGASTGQVDPGAAAVLAPPAGDEPGGVAPATPSTSDGEPDDAEPVPRQQASLAEATAPAQESPPFLAPAGTVTGVSWQATDTGTEVIIRGDGALAAGRVRVNVLSGPPRVLVRLADVSSARSGEQRAVGTSEVERIRFGYHGELSPPELYVVLDLTSAAVALAGHTVEGDVVRLHLLRPR